VLQLGMYRVSYSNRIVVTTAAAAAAATFVVTVIEVVLVNNVPTQVNIL